MKFETKYDVNEYIGKQFYWLTVLGPSDGLSKDGSKQWDFKCVCGKVISRPPARVIGKDCHSKSCGCMRYKNITHKEHNRENLQRVDAESLIGQKNNMLTVIGYERPEGKGRVKLKCKCECGNTVFLLPYQFKSGSVKSCGCILNHDKITHGLSKHSLYSVWASMIKRCYDKESDNYGRYGGRGIFVCEEWRHSPKKFYEWSDSVGGRPEGTTLDRVDNDGPYSPENCRWATSTQQSRNKRSNRLITCNGETKCLSDWCLEYGLNTETLRGRLEKGWTIEAALKTPVGSVENRGKFKEKHKAAP